MKSKRITDREAVLRDLQSGQPLTAVEAYKKYGMMRLSARVFDLRQEYGDGQIITVDRVIEGERIAEYRWNFKYSRVQLDLF